MVLLVEDDDSIRSIVNLTLERAGYHVLMAANGAQALQILRQNKSINIIMTDYHMPGISGAELCRAVRTEQAFKRYHKIPVIMLTVESDSNVIQEAKNIGVNAWITKPFMTEVLVRTVSTLLSKKNNQ